MRRLGVAAVGAVVALAAVIFLFGRATDSADRRRLAELRHRHDEIKAEMIRLQIELEKTTELPPVATTPTAHPRFWADPRYSNLYSELSAVLTEYDAIRDRHPDWSVPRLTMAVDDRR